MEENVNNTPGELEFPASIQANLCLEIDTDPDTLFGILENCPATISAEPLKVTCSVLSLSEADCVFGSAGFFDDQGVEQATVDGGNLSLVEISIIGGVAQLPDAAAAAPVAIQPASGPNAAVLAYIAWALTAAVVALGTVAWQLRRRRPFK